MGVNRIGMVLSTTPSDEDRATGVGLEVAKKLARIRDALKAQPAPAQDVDRATQDRWVNSTTSNEAILRTTHGSSAFSIDVVEALCHPTQHVYKVTITAERVEPAKESE